MMSKNGILPVRLPRAIVDQLIDDSKLGGNARVTVDLERQVVVRPNGEEIAFEIDPFRKHLLLNGLDDIGQTMQHGGAIDGYCVGEPWNARAIVDKVGFTAATTQDIWKDHPEKVLGTTAEFVQKNPNTCRAAIAAILLVALIFGPSWWIRHVLRKDGVERPDLPGTGAEFARHLLDEAKLDHVKVEVTDEGDHYDPLDRAVRLLPQHHDVRSVAAVAVAAHEVSHAIQHARGEPAFRARQILDWVYKKRMRTWAVLSGRASGAGAASRCRCTSRITAPSAARSHSCAAMATSCCSSWMR